MSHISYACLTLILSVLFITVSSIAIQFYNAMPGDVRNSSSSNWGFVVAGLVVSVLTAFISLCYFGVELYVAFSMKGH